MELYKEAHKFAKRILCDFEHGESTEQATKQDIENADSRKKKNRISEEGSYVYAAYDNSERLLYVGETGKSIKRRFISDGTGAYKEKNKCWYEIMENVRFKKN